MGSRHAVSKVPSISGSPCSFMVKPYILFELAAYHHNYYAQKYYYCANHNTPPILTSPDSRLNGDAVMSLLLLFELYVTRWLIFEL